MRAVGEEVTLGVVADDLGQTLFDFAVKEAEHLAHALQGESLAPELADDGHFSQLVHRVEPAMAFPLRPDHAALVPPLQLPRRNAGESNHVSGCEAILHRASSLFKTIF